MNDRPTKIFGKDGRQWHCVDCWKAAMTIEAFGEDKDWTRPCRTCGTPLQSLCRRMPKLQVGKISSRQSHQQQLFAHFLRGALPATYAAELGDVANSISSGVHTNVLSHAIDAVGYAFLGVQTHDERSTRVAQASYGATLSCLRSFLPLASRQISAGREILLAILLASVCEKLMLDGGYAPNVDRHELAHQWATQQFIGAHGIEWSVPRRELDRLLLSRVVGPSIVLGTARRQGLDGGFLNLLKKDERLAIYRGLMTILSHVPALLEVTDRFLDKLRQVGKHPSTDLSQSFSSLCARIEANRKQIAGYFRKYIDGDLLLEVDASDFSVFDFTIEEHVIMSASTVFPTYLQLKDSCYLAHLMPTLVLYLVVNCNILRLLHFKPSAAPFFPPEDVIIRNANDVAVQTCRCLYSSSQHDSLAWAHFMVHILSLLQNYFAEGGAVGHLGWCQVCLIATRSRIQRLEREGMSTVCRVGDIPAGFANAGSYRTWKSSEKSPLWNGRACGRHK